MRSISCHCDGDSGAALACTHQPLFQIVLGEGMKGGVLGIFSGAIPEECAKMGSFALHSTGLHSLQAVLPLGLQRAAG